METRLLAPLVALALTACAPEALAPTAHNPADDTLQSRLIEGSPEALGLLAFLNDEDVTEEVLDHLVALDARAARSLIDHRNGGDGVYGTADDDDFDSVAEVDDCYYVGASAIDKILAYAWMKGFVAEGDEHLGTYDDVAFTVDEAELTLDVVNTESWSVLDDDLGLDERAVESIFAARPVESVLELSQLYYVGESAITRLKDYALGGSVCDLDPLFDLSDAIAGGDGNFRVLVNDDFDWQEALAGRDASGALSGASCFGLSADEAPEGAVLKERLAEPEELVANLAELGSMARVDSSDGVDAMECEVDGKRFFGCHLSFEDAWSGTDQFIFVSTDERFQILFEARWYE